MTAAAFEHEGEAYAMHLLAKRDELERHALAFADEVLARVLTMVDSVAYVKHYLYSPDEPEGRLLPNAVERLRASATAFAARAEKIHTLADDMNNEGEEGEPYNPIYWDKVRVQQAGTHEHAVKLAAEVVAIAFTCHQYASTKYVWRGAASSDGGESCSERNG